jgi:hypothetical protein
MGVRVTTATLATNYYSNFNILVGDREGVGSGEERKGVGRTI